MEKSGSVLETALEILVTDDAKKNVAKPAQPITDNAAHLLHKFDFFFILVNEVCSVRGFFGSTATQNVAGAG